MRQRGFTPLDRSRNRLTGFTLVEMSAVVAVLAIVLAIAIPSFLKMRMVANEAAVVEGMRAVHLACESHRMAGTAGGGVGEYPLWFRTLTASNPPYLDGRFNAVVNGAWRGYRWIYTPGPQRQQTVGNVAFLFRDTYVLRTDPSARGFDGQRSFYMDQTGVIRFNAQGPAGPASPELQ